MEPGGCEHLSVLEKARRFLRRRALGGKKGLREALLGGSPPAPRADESQGEHPSRAPLEDLTYDCEDAVVPIPEDPFMIMGESLLDEIVKDCSKEVQIFLTQPTSTTSGLLTEAGKCTPAVTRVSNISDRSRKIPKGTQSESQSMADSQSSALFQKPEDLNGVSAGHLDSLWAPKSLLWSILQTEAVIRMFEVRLTEEDTLSLEPAKVEAYRASLKKMKSDLSLTKPLLGTMEAELQKALRIHSQSSQAYVLHDSGLGKYREKVGQLMDRWQKVEKQIDDRIWDLEKQVKQLRTDRDGYQALNKWTCDARRRQDTTETVKLGDVSRTTVMRYSQEPKAGEIQSRYTELLTRSGEDYKFSSKMLNFLSEVLKMKSTKIELLEEELRLARGANSDNSNKHRFLVQKKIIEEKEYEIERLRVLLQDEGTWNREYENEPVKERNHLNEEMNNVKNKYETEIKITTIQQIASQKREDAKSLQVQIERLQRENRDLKEEIVRLNEAILETTEEQRRAEDSAPQRKARGTEVAQQKQQLELELEQVLQLRNEEDNVWSKQVLEDAAMTIQDKVKKASRLKIQLREEAKGRRELENELAKVKNDYDEEVISLKNKYETEMNISIAAVNEATVRKEEEAGNDRAQLNNVVRENKSLCEEIRRLKNTLSQTTENLRQLEESVQQQKAAGSEISQKKQHLEIELKQTVQKYMEETVRYEQLLDDAGETIKEKNKEIAKLRKMLQAETNQRKSMEEENIQLQKIQFGLEKVDISATETISRLKVQEQELGHLKSEYEVLSQEKKGKDQDNTRLQSTMQDLKHQKNKVPEELHRPCSAITEEVSKQEKVEEELESMRRSSREQAVKIINLTQPTEEVSIVKERSENDPKHQREVLDNHLADKQSCMQEIRKYTSEIETLRHPLVQEQDNLRQAYSRNEHLQELIEENSKSLDECKIEIEGLQSLTENLTKEPLMLDEESCRLRSDYNDLKRSRSGVDEGENATIIELKSQLQTTSKHALKLQSQISGLQTERENLRQDIEKYQKQALEEKMKYKVLRDKLCLQQEVVRKEEEIIVWKMHILGHKVSAF